MNQDISRTLGRIESNTANVQGDLKEVKLNIKTMDHRIQHIERQYSFWRGGLGTLLLVGTIVGSLLDFLIMKWFR